MPRIRRWFHVSHDINSDPEVWELTDTFGDWMLRVWLQMLSIGDRNEFRIKGERKWIESRMATLWRSNSRRYGTEWRRNRVSMALNWMANKGWIRFESDAIIICNQAKYNPSREAKESPVGKAKAPPPILSSPFLSSQELQKDLTVLSAPAVADPPDVPSNGLPNPTEIQASWNTICGATLGKVVRLTDTRRRKIRVRLTDLNELHKWEVLFRRIMASPFLRGEKGTWKASLDWLVANDTNWVKVMEGKYAESAPR